MKTISLPQTAYKSLLKKAQMTEQFLALIQKQYPAEEYSQKRMREFKTNDRLSAQLRKDIGAILTRFKKNA